MAQVAQTEQEEILDEFHTLSFIKFSQKEIQELKSISSEGRWASKFKRTLEMKGFDRWLAVNFRFLERWSESQRNKALENRIVLVETILDTCPDHIKQWKIPLLAKGMVLDWLSELQADFKFKLDCEAQDTANKLILLIRSVEANEDNNKLVVQMHKLTEKFKPKEDDPVHYVVKDLLKKIIQRAKVSLLHTEAALENKSYGALMDIMFDIYMSLDTKERLRDVSEEAINAVSVKCAKCGLYDAHRLRCPEYHKNSNNQQRQSRQVDRYQVKSNLDAKLGRNPIKYPNSKSKGGSKSREVTLESDSGSEDDGSSKKKRSHGDRKGKNGSCPRQRQQKINQIQVLDAGTVHSDDSDVSVETDYTKNGSLQNSSGSELEDINKMEEICEQMTPNGESLTNRPWLYEPSSTSLEDSDGEDQMMLDENCDRMAPVGKLITNSSHSLDSDCNMELEEDLDNYNVMEKTDDQEAPKGKPVIDGTYSPYPGSDTDDSTNQVIGDSKSDQETPIGESITGRNFLSDIRSEKLIEEKQCDYKAPTGKLITDKSLSSDYRTPTGESVTDRSYKDDHKTPKGESITDRPGSTLLILNSGNEVSKDSTVGNGTSKDQSVAEINGDKYLDLNTQNKNCEAPKDVSKLEFKRQEIDTLSKMVHEVNAVISTPYNDEHFAAIDSAATTHVVSEEVARDFHEKINTRVRVKMANGTIQVIDYVVSQGLLKEAIVMNTSHALVSLGKLVQVGAVFNLKREPTMEFQGQVFKLKFHNNFFYLSKEQFYSLLNTESEENIYSVVDQYHQMIELKSQDPVMNFHRVFGHVSLSKMKYLVREKLVKVNKKTAERVLKMDSLQCPVCMLTKVKRNPVIKTVQDDTTYPFEKIGIDYIEHKELPKGLFTEPRLRNLNGLKAAFIIIDYHTNYGMIVPVASKEEGVVALAHAIQTALTFNYVIKEVRSDRGKELVKQQCLEFMSAAMINHTTSVPGRKNQNGKCERYIQTLLAMTRCVLLDAGIDDTYWLLALRYSVDKLNMIPRKGRLKSPSEEVGQELPKNYEFLPVFWQAGTVNEPEKVTGLGKRSIEVNFAYMDTSRPNKRYWVVKRGSGELVLREDFRKYQLFALMHGNSDTENNSAHIIAKVDEQNEEGILNDPKSLDEALDRHDGQEWLEAARVEAQNLKDHHTFKQVRGYVDEKIIPTFMLFKKTVDNEENIKYKVRLVVMGNTQHFDSTENIFAPTCSADTNLFLDNIAVNWDLKIAILDVKAAFLKGCNDREEYVSVPKRFANLMGFDRTVLKLVGNLYGTRQAPKIWFQTLKQGLVDLGFTQLDSSPTLFVKGNFKEENFLLISTYVDDLKILYRSELVFESFVEEFNQVFPESKFSKNFSKLLGVEYSMKQNEIRLNHKQFFIKNLQEYNSKIRHLPKLSISDKRAEPEEMEKVLRLAGTLRFAADRGRPDLLYHVNELVAGWVQEPWAKIQEVARYAYSTANSGLTFKKHTDFRLMAHVDASHIRCGDGRSRLAGALFFNQKSGTFSSFSTKITKNFTTVSISSCESELKAIYTGIIHLEYFSKILKELRIPVTGIPTIYTDNVPAIDTIKNGAGGTPLRHLNVRIAYIAHCVNSNKILVEHVPTELNRADVLTKYMVKEKFQAAREKLCGESVEHGDN